MTYACECVIILTLGHLGNFKVIEKKRSKLLSDLLFYFQKAFLRYVKITHDLRMYINFTKSHLCKFKVIVKKMHKSNLGHIL